MSRAAQCSLRPAHCDSTRFESEVRGEQRPPRPNAVDDSRADCLGGCPDDHRGGLRADCHAVRRVGHPAGRANDPDRDADHRPHASGLRCHVLPAGGFHHHRAIHWTVPHRRSGCDCGRDGRHGRPALRANLPESLRYDGASDARYGPDRGVVRRDRDPRDPAVNDCCCYCCSMRLQQLEPPPAQRAADLRRASASGG